MNKNTHTGILQKKEQDFFPLYSTYGYLIVNNLKFYTNKEFYHKYRIGKEVEISYTQTVDGRFVNNIHATGIDLFSEIKETITKTKLNNSEREYLESTFKFTTYLQAGFLSLLLSGMAAIVFFSIFEFSKYYYYAIPIVIVFFINTNLIRNSWVAKAKDNLKAGYKLAKVARLEEIFNNGDEEGTASVSCYIGRENITFHISMHDDYKFKEHSHFIIYALKNNEILSVHDLQDNLLIKMYP